MCDTTNYCTSRTKEERKNLVKQILQLPFKSPFQSFVNAGFQMQYKNNATPLFFSSALLARSNTLTPFSRQIRETQDVLSQCGSPEICHYSHLLMNKILYPDRICEVSQSSITDLLPSYKAITNVHSTETFWEHILRNIGLTNYLNLY